MVSIALGLDLVVFFLGLVLLAVASRKYRDEGETRTSLLGLWMALLWIAIGLFGLAQSAGLSSGVSLAAQTVAVALGLLSLVYGYKGWNAEPEGSTASGPEV